MGNYCYQHGAAMGWGNPCTHMMPHALTAVPFTAASSHVPEGLSCQRKGRCPRVAWEQINNQKDQQCTKQKGARVGPWQQKPEKLQQRLGTATGPQSDPCSHPSCIRQQDIYPWLYTGCVEMGWLLLCPCWL